MDFFCFPRNRQGNLKLVDGILKKLNENWKHLRNQNLEKANYICSGNNNLPINKNDVTQNFIFEKQLNNYIIPKNSVAILNAFPLFLYEYFR